jgi:CheY-like chemotaxis protein
MLRSQDENDLRRLFFLEKSQANSVTSSTDSSSDNSSDASSLSTESDTKDSLFEIVGKRKCMEVDWKYELTTTGLSIDSAPFELPSALLLIDDNCESFDENKYFDESSRVSLPPMTLKRSRSFFSMAEDGVVLVVDDSALCRKALIHTLEHLGYRYETANDGVEACRLVQNSPLKYSVIMMDFKMPKMDGLEASAYIKKILKSHIPIIIMTGENVITSGVTIKQVNASGVEDYLLKPVQITDIHKKFAALGIGADAIRWRDGSTSYINLCRADQSSVDLEYLGLCQSFHYGMATKVHDESL